MERLPNIMSDILDIPAGKFYDDTYRPLLVKFRDEYRTDGELSRTAGKLINAFDSEIQRGQWKEVLEDVDILTKAVATDRNYFSGVISTAPEQERDAVKDLIDKTETFILLAKVEQDERQKKHEPPKKHRKRLDYTEDQGSPMLSHNNDYPARNMETLNRPVPKPRIPNV